MIEIRTPQTDDEWNDYYQLRYDLLRKPLGKEPGSERNDGDENGIHLALYDNGQLAAITRLDQADTKIAQVRFVAVSEEFRRQGFGKLIMEESESLARDRGDRKMILHARENALEFYRELGYRLIEKTHLLFGQVQHYLMERNL